MAKTANVYARIEPNVKERAEDILSVLGITVSSAINMFYKQIIFNNGIPFELKIDPPRIDLAKLSRSEIEALLEKGVKDFEEGRHRAAEDIFAEYERNYGI